eukprot:GFUD01086416.1.p1 GENE.GFUD01086416.1~~GFUD01086416.1.p1  ORF type:complete len:386 (-),score=80.17 GFUD01086416.1:151-1308(-)
MWGQRGEDTEEGLLLDKKEHKNEKINFKRSSLNLGVQALSLTIIVCFFVVLYLSLSQNIESSEIEATIVRGIVDTKNHYGKKEFEEVNDRPIIGVLTQQVDSEPLSSHHPPGYNYTSLAASYVQWVQAGGARVVPIIIGKDVEYYTQLFASINGLLLPGGSAPLTGAGGYADVGGLFFQLAKEANDAGDTFPIWGTCNGFELLTVLSSKDTSRLIDCDSQDQAVPLNLLTGWERSSVFSSAPPDVIKEVTEEKITINFHERCLTPANFTKYRMETFWNALSYNYDKNHLEYISSIEAKDYPFFGTQFHPEKNIFEWNEQEPMIPHSRHAVHVSLYFATHFVNMARKSRHIFKDRDTEEKFLIYRYQPQYVGREDLDWTFEEVYLF